MPNSHNQKAEPDLKRTGSNRVRISASFKPGMDKELGRIADEDGVNKSQVLQQMLAKEIIRRRRLKSNG